MKVTSDAPTSEGTNIGIVTRRSFAKPDAPRVSAASSIAASTRSRPADANMKKYTYML